MGIFKPAITLAALSLCLCSCDGFLFDNEEACREGVELQFVYDYNMEWADAFASKVDCLTVMLYDTDGKLVETRTETFGSASRDGYRMAFDVPAGSYRVLAYGGMACQEAAFSFAESPENERLQDVRVSLSAAQKNADGTQTCRELLHDHFHGLADVVVQERGVAYTQATVELVKNTNHFRIMLQQTSGEALNASDFRVSISDDNTLFSFDNSIISAPETPVTYYPWSLGDEVVGSNADGTPMSVAYFELSTSRLMRHMLDGAVCQNQQRLLIERSDDGALVAEIPLLTYLLLYKSDRYRDMGDQEFLDRNSEWQMMFFLDKNSQWVKTHFRVNDWDVRLNDTDI